jgi:hypothetical protein
VTEEASAGTAENPYAKLPERVLPEDMITEQASREPGDPTLGGRDSDRDWMLKYT